MNDDTPLTTPPANGHAFRAYLESASSVLSRLTVADYYPSPLPSPVDDALAEIVSAFTAWPLPLREQFIESISSDGLGLFGIFGHRAATLAIRNGDPDLLRLGLIGNSIANYTIPPGRNVDIALAVFYHCARKMALKPIDLFYDAARYASEAMAAHLTKFGRRTDVTLKQFGWREIKTPDGVRYKMDW